MRVLKEFKNTKQFLSVIFILFSFFILRLPSLFEPLWYGDEGIYQAIGSAINHGKLLYSQIFDNKPPLLYWLYAIFQSDQFTVRLASLIFGAFTVVMFFFLSKKLFQNAERNNNIHLLTTFIFAVLFGLPMLEGNIANAENFMLLPIIASALIISNFKSHLSPAGEISDLKLFIAGALLGIASLFKIVAVFDLSAFLVFYFILNLDSLRKEIRISKILAGFFAPILLVSSFFAINGTFMDFAKAVLTSNISYVSYGNKIGNLPLLLLMKLILLGGLLLLLFVKRKKINYSSLFILIWLVFSLFNAFFSQRPYVHYILVLIPSLSLMTGLILFDKKYQKNIVITLLIVLVIVVKGFGISLFDKSINYYRNFISYVMGKKTMVQYQAFFDRNTPFDYEIARFIKPKITKNDTIFVWGNNAQLYQLIGVIAPTKYIVAYHISNYKDGPTDTRSTIEKVKPKFIVIIANNNSIPFSLINYSKKINIDKASIYERIF